MTIEGYALTKWLMEIHYRCSTHFCFSPLSRHTIKDHRSKCIRSMIQSKEKIPELWKHCFQFSQQLYKKKEKTKDLRLDKKKRRVETAQ